MHIILVDNDESCCNGDSVSQPQCSNPDKAIKASCGERPTTPCCAHGSRPTTPCCAHSERPTTPCKRTASTSSLPNSRNIVIGPICVDKRERRSRSTGGQCPHDHSDCCGSRNEPMIVPTALSCCPCASLRSIPSRPCCQSAGTCQAQAAPKTCSKCGTPCQRTDARPCSRSEAVCQTVQCKKSEAGCQSAPSKCSKSEAVCQTAPSGPTPSKVKSQISNVACQTKQCATAQTRPCAPAPSRPRPCTRPCSKAGSRPCSRPGSRPKSAKSATCQTQTPPCRPTTRPKTYQPKQADTKREQSTEPEEQKQEEKQEIQERPRKKSEERPRKKSEERPRKKSEERPRKKSAEQPKEEEVTEDEERPRRKSAKASKEEEEEEERPRRKSHERHRRKSDERAKRKSGEKRKSAEVAEHAKAARQSMTEPDQFDWAHFPTVQLSFNDYVLKTEGGTNTVLALSKASSKYEKLCKEMLAKLTEAQRTEAKEFFLQTTREAIKVVKVPDSNNTAITHYHLMKYLKPIVEALQLDAHQEVHSIHKAGIMKRFLPLYLKLKDTLARLATARDFNYPPEMFVKELRKLMLAMYLEIICLDVSFNNTLTSLSYLPSVEVQEKYRNHLELRKTHARRSVAWGAGRVAIVLLYYYVSQHT
ncbi:hypothetical protein Ocin01_12290 [Orchesella cincta]|uniref:Uncharacterized protein n=1 Tax=Orchesella cincta TaxID=48709 RepID=A0A1D2MN69_ORCCI|nr:hypothetical protein Ocin01_12290 [Orchesella cincta]